MDEEVPSFRAAAPARKGALKAQPQSRLKLAHLRLIAAIEDTETVSAAAQAVNMSQPAASRMIAELEALLAATLCERLSRGVRLTPLGHALARHARSMLLQLAQAEQEFAELREGRRGLVSLGAVTAPAIDLAAPAMTVIRAAAPAIELNIKVDNSNVLARDLLASRLDFMIARVPDDLDARLFDSLVIGVEEARLVVRRGHPLLARGSAPIGALNAYEWVMQPRGAPIRRAIDNVFQAANAATPDRLVNTTSFFLTMMLVARSDAIAPLSVEAARFACQEGAPGALALLPTDFAIVVQPYSLIALRGRPLSPAAQTVFDIIRAQALARAAPPASPAKA
ncbi:MAG TPA: LysR family transcriptional regulator [Roseiarcus sp.]